MLRREPLRAAQPAAVRAAGLVRSPMLVAALACTALALVPIWAVRYVPIFDYYNHLLEAQVAARHGDPALGYAAGYTLRDGWELRSNALSTLLMAWLSYLVPIEVAGKLALSGYVALLVGGLAALLAALRRPWWLLLAAPALCYNLTFTAGMLNWSYGLALLPWALLAFLRWECRPRWASLAALALVSALCYAAHVLAWLLLLAVLLSLAAAAAPAPRRLALLTLALSAAAPMQLASRPLMALAPPGLALAFWACAWVARRLGLGARRLALLGGAAAAAGLALIKLAQPRWSPLLPDVGYSLYAKAVAIPRLLPLPQQTMPPQLDVAAAGALLLAICLAAAALLAAAHWGRQPSRWLAPLGVLAMAFVLLPHRTADIIVVEPRVALFAWVVALAAADIPAAPRRLGRALAWLHALAAGLALASAAVYAWRYDAVAERWSDALRQIPPREQVLVLSLPPQIPGDPAYALVRLGQPLDGSQFASVYALERGGLVSNSFFNGPLDARRPEAIPPYWWIDFAPGAYVRGECRALRGAYSHAAVWNGDDSLGGALAACGWRPIHTEGQLTVWDQPR